MAHIIVLGAGIGGMSAAYELRAALGPEHSVTVVGDGPRFSFTPSNPWVAVGWRKPPEIQVDAGKYLGKKNIDFVPEAATRIDAANKSLTTVSGKTLDFDYLVICTGPRLAFDEIPGFGPINGHTQSICTTEHATSAWEQYQEFLKNPGPIVVGAVAGASCFGPAYEFAMILDADLRKRKLRDRVPITFVSSEPYVGHMGLGGVGDSKGLLESEFRQRHIKWITNCKVREFTENQVTAIEHNDHGEVLREHVLPFKFAMMMPAFTGVAAVAAVEGLCNPRGFVLIDEFQRNPGFPHICSAGVCVAIAPTEPTPVPTGVPKTGFMIESMVSAIVHNLKAAIEGKAPSAKATWNAICLADMGDTGAAFVAIPQMPPRNVTWAKVGRWVHVAKIAFEKYFLAKMKSGNTEPIYEKYVLKALGIGKLK
ncbi:MAG: FAD/NAD(P)-binding oxidoreductase [Lysobacterales bacterium]|nr:NAD(P)/FAD-dependent oxidoreductase [Xanthomonadales bacterium]MCB1610815.1 NAD(P)/FAD-dependent oxidoreductase [Xanthomonadales bacterium]MCP5473317.1 NAD(P)/FAD-dependent oxidoreductase [Rhodanobacteraceae bacterium]